MCCSPNRGQEQEAKLPPSSSMEASAYRQHILCPFTFRWPNQVIQPKVARQDNEWTDVLAGIIGVIRNSDSFQIIVCLLGSVISIYTLEEFSCLSITAFKPTGAKDNSNSGHQL